jgi:hypothetical protein
MERVARMADAASIAEPTPELCLIAGLIIHLTRGKPEEVAELVDGVRSFVDAQQQMAGIIRLRGAEYDGAVLSSMAKAAGWLERMEPFLIMMSKR